MADDLAGAKPNSSQVKPDAEIKEPEITQKPPVEKTVAPANLPTQIQKTPTGKKAPIKVSQKSEKKSPKDLAKIEAKTFLSEGISLFQRKFYKEAIEQLKKATNSSGSSFLNKRKAKSLIVRAQKALQKQTSSSQPVQEDNQKKENKPKVRRSLNWPKIIIFGLILLLIIAGIYLGFKYFSNSQEPEVNNIPETPQIQSADDPVELISGQFREIIDYKNDEQLINDLQTSLNKELRGGFLKNLFFKKVEDFKERYLTLPELLASTNSQIPPQIQDNFSGEYNLLIYQQEEGNENSPFQQSFSNNKRLVLVIKLKNKDQLDQDLLAWENTMVDDLSLLYAEKSIGDQKTNEFQENFYRGALIRYLNFPEPNLSIDYLVLDNLLVFATSRESTFATANKIMEAI